MHISFQFFFSLTHQLITESGRTDRKICCIVSQRIKHLTVGNAPCHHNIRGCMGFREHVLNLLTGPDIPVRYIVIDHILLPFRPFVTFSFCHNSLPDILHNLKRFLGIQSHANQIDHDIIPCTDGGRNRCLLFLNQCLCIAKPYVRTMGQPCNTHQIRKFFWLCIN